MQTNVISGVHSIFDSFQLSPAVIPFDIDIMH